METISLRNSKMVEGADSSQIEQRSADAIFVRSQTVVSRSVAGETLIVPVRGKVGDLASIYSLNGTGSLIWETLADPHGIDELVNAVEREYDVGREQAERDVLQFVNDMLSVGLVEARPAVAMAAMEAGTGAAAPVAVR
jgi:hypothetical protein